MTRVELSHVTKHYSRDRAAVEDISLVIQEGRLTALLGPSGCGKTTILKMIAGLLSPSSGDIRFDGESVLHVPAERRKAVMVFQNHLLFPYLNVEDNIAFGLKMADIPAKHIRQKVDEMLELVRLEGFERRKPAELSGGQQQRVALARALVVEPRVLLLDEPLSNLDAHLRDNMRDLIRRLHGQKRVTTVYVTHDQEEAVMLADRLALIIGGRLQQAAEPRKLYEKPANLEVARFFGAKNCFSGTVSNHTIHTDLGVFQVEGNHLAAGPVELAIRPENVQVSSEQSVQVNTICGELQSYIFAGTRAHLKVRVRDMVFEIVTEPESAPEYHPGDNLQLYFPPGKLWAFESN